MPGRTDKVNARDLIDRADGIIFEGDVVRGWLAQLVRRTRGTLEAAQKNEYFERELGDQCDELNEALSALQKAQTSLDLFANAVAKRGG